MGQSPLRERFEPFGSRVIETDGHDAQEPVRAFYDAKYLGMDGSPACILAHTVKGRGVRECESSYRWHTSAPAREVAAIPRDIAGWSGGDANAQFLQGNAAVIWSTGDLYGMASRF